MQDFQTARKWQLKWWQILCVMIVFAPVGYVADGAGKIDLVMPTAMSLLSIVLLIVLKWDLRTRFWFWAVVVIFAALETVLLFWIHWPNHWVPAVSFAGLASLYFVIMLGVVSVIRSYIETHSAEPAKT